ncbi:cytochrome P450 [Streptomyces sp. CC210A]|uniref:cytochrome P450 n=1 Tax=Streptomyces sp. CC210A TaxID=2898184 RepID=UPI001F2949D9|nr:cytochrome P450 [Streptomyces sp. CC210A]
MSTPTPRRRTTGRRRDRRVHTRSHPVLTALLAASRRTPVTRIGGTVLVHGTDAFREALTRVPLDRTAPGTTGGAARELSSGGLLFDQEGDGHRDARRGVAADLGAAGVERLRPVWREVLERRLAPLETGGSVDLVPLAREVAGATVLALLDGRGDPLALAGAAAEAAATAVRDHLPGPRPPGASKAAAAPPPGWSACWTTPRDGPPTHREVRTSRRELPAPAPRTPGTAGRRSTGRPVPRRTDCGRCWPWRP